MSTTMLTHAPAAPQTVPGGGAVLIIDDDATMCHALSRAVRRINCEAVSTGTMGEGMQLAQARPFDIIFLDVRLPDGNGLTLLPELTSLPYTPEVIIITGKGDPDGAELAIGNGAWDYIEKTHSIQQITLTLTRALEFHKKRKLDRKLGTVKALRREHIVGDSPALQRALDLVATCAQNTSNVLITGETGTGKELFARAIHDNSDRRDGPFVIVDCASLPETLVESILFGHKKGAFTGAERDQLGLVLQADGGTLFLDEIGEMPLSLQKVFLRVLQERTVRSLGGRDEKNVDFRLVAATNRDLERMVAEGGFRNDLLYRVRSINIELPPLRERTQDIRPLVNHFIDRLCARSGEALKGACADFFETLEAYGWPGNVRELIHTLEHALAAALLDSYLLAQHLPPALRAKVARSRVTPQACECGTPFLETEADELSAASLPSLQQFRDDALARLEQRYLSYLMTVTAGNMKEAIRLSGLSQSRLYALLKKHGVATR